MRLLRRSLKALFVTVGILAVCLWTWSFWFADSVELRQRPSPSPCQLTWAIGSLRGFVTVSVKICSAPASTRQTPQTFPPARHAPISTAVTPEMILISRRRPVSPTSIWHHLNFNWIRAEEDVIFGPEVKFGALGFGPSPGEFPKGKSVTYWVRAPYWWLALLSFLPVTPFILSTFRHVRRSRRTRRQQCVNCGYDLRASGDVRPECGEPVRPPPPPPPQVAQKQPRSNDRDGKSGKDG